MNEMTPKEKYDAEMKDINNTIKPAPEKEAGFTDEEVEEHEEEVEALNDAVEEIDKTVGQEKVTVTQQQFQEQKKEDARKKTLGDFTGVGGLRRDKLSPQHEAVMAQVLKLEEEGKLEDPVLKHLVGKKVELAQEKMLIDKETKDFQLQIVETMKDLTEKVVKVQGAVDTYNRDILLYVQKNPGVIDGGSNT